MHKVWGHKKGIITQSNNMSGKKFFKEKDTKVSF